MQKKTLLLISLIITFILTASTVVFAWFTVVEKTQPILIYSGSLKLEAELFEISDTEIPITSSYDFGMVVPGDIYKFRLDLVNLGTLDANLAVKITLTNNLSATLRNFFVLNYDGIEPENINNDVHTIDLETLYGIGQSNLSNEMSFTFDLLIDKDILIDDLDNNGYYIKIESIELTLIQLAGEDWWLKDIAIF